MWPAAIQPDLMRLMEEQDYLTFWHAVLLLHFPQALGFSIRVPKINRNHVDVPYLAVNHSSRTLLVVTWETPKRTRQAAHFWDQAFRPLKFKDRSVHSLRSLGLIVSYHKLDTRSWDSTISHPHNVLYGFHEPCGVSLIMTCFSNVWEAARMPWTSIIDAANLSAARKRIAQSTVTILANKQLISQRNNSHSVTHSPPATKDTTGQARPMSHITPFRHAFPSDVAAEIVSYLDVPSLRSLSCANSLYNDLADRRLWRVFHVATKTDDEPQEVADRLDALSLNPRRALFVQSLVLGPCGWRWSTSLLSKLRDAILAARNMSSLTLLRSSTAHRIWGGEFSPVLNILAQSGSQIHLRSFEFHDWFDGSTALIDFLATQTGLERLARLDIPKGRLLVLPPGFLPALSVIDSSMHRLSRTLVRGRPIKSVLVSADPVNRDTVLDRLDALSGSTASIESLGMIARNGCSASDVTYIYGQVAARLPNLKELRTGGFTFRPYAFEILRLFPRLENFHCNLGRECSTIDGFREWIAQAPSTLRRVAFWSPGRGTVVWGREPSVRDMKLHRWRYMSEDSSHSYNMLEDLAFEVPIHL